MAAFGVDGANARTVESDAVCAPAAAEVSRLEALPPGPQLATALVAVMSRVMDTALRVRVCALWERQRAWTDAQVLVALSDAAGCFDAESDRWVASDVAIASHLSEYSIGQRMALMRHVGECLPATFLALQDGRIALAHVCALAAVTAPLDPALATAVEGRVLETAVAKGWPPAQLRDAARRAALRLDPDGAVARARAAKATRSDVTLRPDEDEMATLAAATDAWTARQLMDEINRRADALRAAGDPRNLGELRVAALEAAMLGVEARPQTEAEAETAETETDAPDAATAPHRPRRATALLLITLDTLLGGDQPGHLDGHGPISAALARRIAASDIRFRRLVLDPMTGRPLDLGDASYQLSARMRRWLEARDRTCRFPACRRRAAFCDADHAEEWPAGKTTCANCGLLCRKHHNYKTGKQWDLARDDDDGVTWLSPHGLEWFEPAATYEEFLDGPDPPPERMTA